MLPKVEGAQSSDDVLEGGTGLSVRNGGGDDATVRHIPIVADGKVYGYADSSSNVDAAEAAIDPDAPTEQYVFDTEVEDDAEGDVKDDAGDSSVDEGVPYGTSYVVPTDPATQRDVIAHTHGSKFDVASDIDSDAPAVDDPAIHVDTPHGSDDGAAAPDGNAVAVEQAVDNNADSEGVAGDAAADDVDEDIARERKVLWRNAAIVGVSVLAVFGLGYIVSDMRNGASEPSTIPEMSHTQILMSSEPDVSDEPNVVDQDENTAASTLRLPAYVSEVNSSSLAPSPEESAAATREPERDTDSPSAAGGRSETKEAPSEHKGSDTPSKQESVPVQPSPSPSVPSAQPTQNADGSDKPAPKRENTVININESREVAPGVKVALSDPHLVKNVGVNRETLLCANVAIANRSGKDVVYNADMWKVRTPKGSDLFPPVVNIESKNFVEGVVQNNKAIDAPLCFIYQSLGRYEFIYDDPHMEGTTTWRATF